MIRRLTPNDAAAYRELRLNALQIEPNAFVSDFEVEKQRAELFLEKCLKENAEVPFVFGAFEGKELIGIAAFTGDELIQLFVLPQYRGKGLGHQLASAVISHAFRELNLLLYINVAVVLRETNARAIYESLGFEANGMDSCTHNGYQIQLLTLSRANHRQ